MEELSHAMESEEEERSTSLSVGGEPRKICFAGVSGSVGKIESGMESHKQEGGLSDVLRKP